MPAPSKAPTAIAYFVSAHGFGHAARSAAVMTAIQRRSPEIHFHIFTQAPSWFFADSIAGPHTYHAMETDVGLVQRSPLEEDLGRTLARLDALFPLAADRLTTCCRRVAAHNCRLVICDIAALGIAVAKALGLPSILVENFTWDWIYARYGQAARYGEAARYPKAARCPDAPPKLKAHARYQAELYAQASYRIQAEPVCRHLPVDLTVPPVCRRSSVPRALTRQQLDITQETPLVLVTMGGTPVTYTFLNRLRQHKEIGFLLPGLSQTLVHEGNLIMMPARSEFRHPDLISAADAVVGKVGYSTLAEIYHAGTPFGFVQRPDFPESPPLADYIRTQMASLEIAPRDFKKGRWISKLKPLLALPRNPPRAPNGAELIADFVLDRLAAP
jgi:UDP:flavonoid glycosyltransferase YjiC (YdhE family)